MPVSPPRVKRIRWQIEGSDISSFCQLQCWVKEVNREQFAGHADWRLPTIEETLSLLGREKGGHGSYIHPCFAIKQDMFIPLTDASQGEIGSSISGRPGCSWPPAPLPEALAGYGAQNDSLLLKKL